jgi:hypothetical protein
LDFLDEDPGMTPGFSFGGSKTTVNCRIAKTTGIAGGSLHLEYGAETYGAGNVTSVSYW